MKLEYFREEWAHHADWIPAAEELVREPRITRYRRLQDVDTPPDVGVDGSLTSQERRIKRRSLEGHASVRHTDSFEQFEQQSEAVTMSLDTNPLEYWKSLRSNTY